MPYNFTLDPHSWDTLHHLLLDPSVVKGTASPFLPSLFIYPYIYLFIFVSENRNLKLFLSTITFYFLFFFFRFSLRRKIRDSKIPRSSAKLEHFITFPSPLSLFYSLFYYYSSFYSLFLYSLYLLTFIVTRENQNSKYP